jgi:hypothetical protein
MGSWRDSQAACAKGKKLFSTGGYALAITWSPEEHSAAIQLCKGTVEAIQKDVLDSEGQMLTGALRKYYKGGFSRNKYGFKPVGKFDYDIYKVRNNS